MGLITKLVITKWNPKNREWYESKGYVFTKWKDEFEVKVEDLSDGSHILVNAKCDGCDKLLENIKWKDYKKCENKDGSYYCIKCASNESKKWISFYDWCIENNREDVLDRWDYTLNKCSPKDITCRTNKKYWFKCTRSIHPSELKNINSFTSGQEGSVYCNMCNSFGQWCYDSLLREQADEIMLRWDYELNGCSPFDISYGSLGFNKKGYYFKCSKDIHPSELKSITHFTNRKGNELDCNMCNSFAQWGYNNVDSQFLEKYWDYSKNIDKNSNPINPWKIPKGWNKKVWIFCQEKDYHHSYDVSCQNFTFNNSRCPFCCNYHGKVHLYDSLGYLYPEVFNIWSNKNKKSPYDYAPWSMEKVYWKCLDGKHKDFRREISSSNSYDFRCPFCVQERDESILQEKTRLYLEKNYSKYHLSHEGKCTLKPKNIIEPPNNSDKKRGKGTLRYDNEIIINDKHLFIEVMGEQHEKEGCVWHKQNAEKYKITEKEELDYQIAKDKYKEQYVYDQGEKYYYIAIWYYHLKKIIYIKN